MKTTANTDVFDEASELLTWSSSVSLFYKHICNCNFGLNFITSVLFLYACARNHQSPTQAGELQEDSQWYYHAGADMSMLGVDTGGQK